MSRCPQSTWKEKVHLFFLLGNNCGWNLDFMWTRSWCGCNWDVFPQEWGRIATHGQIGCPLVHLIIFKTPPLQSMSPLKVYTSVLYKAYIICTMKCYICTICMYGLIILSYIIKILSRKLSSGLQYKERRMRWKTRGKWWENWCNARAQVLSKFCQSFVRPRPRRRRRPIVPTKSQSSSFMPTKSQPASSPHLKQYRKLGKPFWYRLFLFARYWRKCANLNSRLYAKNVCQN